MRKANGDMHYYGPVRARVDHTARRVVLTKAKRKLPLSDSAILKIVAWATDDLGDLVEKGYFFDLQGVTNGKGSHV
jgi:ribosomal protein L3